VGLSGRCTPRGATQQNDVTSFAPRMLFDSVFIIQKFLLNRVYLELIVSVARGSVKCTYTPYIKVSAQKQSVNQTVRLAANGSHEEDVGISTVKVLAPRPCSVGEFVSPGHPCYEIWYTLKLTGCTSLPYPEGSISPRASDSITTCHRVLVKAPISSHSR
jgi:hypothetical protein